MNEPYYICNCCGETSPKSQWGPGHVRCPVCQKIQLTAEQQEAAKKEKGDGNQKV